MQGSITCLALILTIIGMSSSQSLPAGGVNNFQTGIPGINPNNVYNPHNGYNPYNSYNPYNRYNFFNPYNPYNSFPNQYYQQPNPLLGRSGQAAVA